MSGTRLSRRQFLAAGLATAGVATLAACAPKAAPATEAATQAPAQATAAPTAEAATAVPTTAATIQPTDLSNTNLEQIVRLSETRVELRGYAGTFWTSSPNTKTFNDLLFCKKMDELTNVRINYEHDPDGSGFEKVMASGDLRDLMGGWYGANTYAKYGAQGAFVALDDYIAQNQYLSGLIRKWPVIRALCTAPDGKMYVYPQIQEPGMLVFGGFHIRTDWLDEAGVKMPETTEDLYNVLKAMKQKDPKRYPMSGYFGGPAGKLTVNHLIWQWGIGCRGPNNSTDFYHDGDTIAYGPIQPQFRDALAYLNRLWKEELIDPEITTIGDPAVYYKRWTDGIVGVGFGWTDDLNSIIKLNPDMKMVAMTAPKGPSGKSEVLSNAYAVTPDAAFADAGNAWVMASSGKDKDLLAKYMDLWFSRSGSILYNWGIYGDTYTGEPGNFRFTDKVTKDPKMVPNEYIWSVISPQWIAGAYRTTDAYLGTYPDYVQEAIRVWSTPPWQTIQLPPLQFTLDETSTIEAAMGDINTLLDESIIGFINGSKSLDTEYPAMVDKIKGLGIDQITEAYQAAYNRFLALI